MRASLILYTKAAIADTWPDEPAPPGQYPRHLNPVAKGSIESVELGAVLSQIDVAIRRLSPDDAFHRSMLPSLQGGITSVQDRRWAMIANGEPSLSWPLLGIVTFWFVVIFAVAGLTSPRNVVVFTVTALSVVSLTSSVYLAMELDTPLSGLLALSSAPLREALRHITEPPLPEGAP